MKSFTTFIILSITWIIGAFQLNAQNSNAIPSHKIVMQLTSADPMVHKSLMKQISNLKEGWRDSVAIEIVCHGPGMEFLIKEKNASAPNFVDLKSKNVNFVACRNTMKEKKIEEIQLFEGISYVQMGIAEIVVKQEQGWSYIKTGF
jgi:intracellular sulfur oxidation DsrE/DsrF family protein